MASTVKITKKVGCYSKASTSSTKKTTLKVGTKISVTGTMTDKKGNTWFKCSKGWFMSYNKSTKTHYTKESASDVTTTVYKNESSVNVTATLQRYSTLKAAADNSVNNGQALKKNMQLFGLPYQFLPSVDYRVEKVSAELGRKYISEVILDAPVVTILPSKPVYLPGTKDKKSVTQAFLQASAGNMGAIKELAKKQNISDMKFYDIKTAYVEYMRYVNVMCRTTAAFLEIQDNNVDYKINGEVANFMNYDWKNYRWTGSNYRSTIGKVTTTAANKFTKNAKSVFSKFKELGGAISNLFTGEKDKKSNKYSAKINNKNKKFDIKNNQLNLNDDTYALSANEDEESMIENLLRNVHYVQFYCDVSSGVNENIGNESKTSSLKTMFDGASEQLKDLAFMTNSGGIDSKSLQELGSSALGELSNVLEGSVGAINGSVKGLIGRFFGTASNVLKGDNVIMPDIYSNSNYSKSYSITIPLRAMYGNKYSLYMDCLVPLYHILALALPKATSANTYAGPFLVKVFMPGTFICNMGLVESISITKNWESVNVDGLPTEYEVSMTITDLYSDLSMTPSNNPILFINNSSLVEYLAINAGLDLVNSNTTKKFNLIWNSISDSIKDVGNNVVSNITEEMDSILYNIVNLTK